MIRKCQSILLVLVIIILSAFGAILSGCSSEETSQKEPIKVAWISPKTGFDAPSEYMFSTGAYLAEKEINEAGGILGRPLELVTIDTKGTPDGTREACADAHLKRGIDIILGTIIGPNSVALHDYAKENKVLAMVPDNSDEITVEHFDRYTFRTSPYFHAITKTIALYMSTKNWTKVYSSCKDDVHGRDFYNKFWENIEEMNLDVENVGESWPSFTEVDFTAAITKGLGTDADLVIAEVTGPSLISFFTQANEFGLFEKMYVTSAFALCPTHTTAIGTAGFPAEGIVGPTWCPFWMEDPTMQKFVQAYYEFTDGKYYPGLITLNAYEMIYFLAGAMEKAQSTDVEKVIDALEGLTIDSPVGPLYMRDFDHQCIHPIWFAEAAISPDYPIPIGINMVKYGEEVYLTKEQTEARREP